MSKNDEKYKTILVIALGLLIWYFFKPQRTLLVAIIILVALSSISDWFSLWVHLGWMNLSELLGHFIPNILLTIIYFVLLFPIAQLARFFRRTDSMALRNSKSTTFLIRNKSYRKDDFLNPW